MNKKISYVEMADVKTWDYPDFCDAYIDYAEDENGGPLTDSELELLNEDRDFVHDKAMESFSFS